MNAQSPQEVLEAVRRLEADLATIRSRARERERDLTDLRRAIAEDAARERQALVEDMERLVDLIGTSWRATHDQIAALSGEVTGLRDTVEAMRGASEQAAGGLRDEVRGVREEVTDLRRFAERTAGGLRNARVELHLGPAPAHVSLSTSENGAGASG